MLDLRHDRGSLVIGELECSGQLNRNAAFGSVDERLEFVTDPENLSRATLPRDQAEEVVDENISPVRELSEYSNLRIFLTNKISFPFVLYLCGSIAIF